MLDPEFARATCKKRFVDTNILSEPDDNGKLYLMVTQHFEASGDHSGKIGGNRRGLRGGRLTASGGIAKERLSRVDMAFSRIDTRTRYA